MKTNGSANGKPIYTSVMGWVFKMFFAMIISGILAWIILICYSSLSDLFLHGQTAYSIKQAVKRDCIVLKNNSSIWTIYFNKRLNICLPKIASIKVFSQNGVINLQKKFFSTQKVSISIPNEVSKLFEILSISTTFIIQRFIIAFLFFPSLLSIIILSVVDGLVQREIRKYQGCRESTFMFHRIKAIAGYIFLAGIFFFFALPSINNNFLYLYVLTIAIGLIVKKVVENYKKYA